MANYQCDRCSCLIEKNRTALAAKLGPMKGETFDLCPSCATALGEWLASSPGPDSSSKKRS